MFINYLKRQNVRVICVTDHTDSFNEDDEFRMDMMQFVNHMYARDVSKKVTAGYRQKQKDKGVCNMPPIGYYNALIIISEATPNATPITLLSVSFSLKQIAATTVPMTVLPPLINENKIAGGTNAVASVAN